MVSAEAIGNLPDLDLLQVGHDLAPATDLLMASQHIQIHPHLAPNDISAIVTTSFSVQTLLTRITASHTTLNAAPSPFPLSELPVNGPGLGLSVRDVDI
jgi:hypothetical protein